MILYIVQFTLFTFSLPQKRVSFIATWHVGIFLPMALTMRRAEAMCSGTRMASLSCAFASLTLGSPATSVVPAAAAAASAHRQRAAVASEATLRVWGRSAGRRRKCGAALGSASSLVRRTSMHLESVCMRCLSDKNRGVSVCDSYKVFFVILFRVVV